MKLYVRDLKLLINRSLMNEDVSSKKKRWYHLSINDLGDEFVFTPRHPGAPYKDIDDHTIEDDHTKRISWAPSIEKAMEALEVTNSRFKQNFHVYAVNSLPGDVDLSDEFEGCPESPKNQYGTDFNLSRYLDYVEKLTGKRPNWNDAQEDLTNCVPDAPETGEHWATKPVKAKKIGNVIRGKFRPI